ncbi:hypothetical protein C4568_00405 [Candidatus Parcubacteria bacterium]|nr:MAG: hypothetical protein C4568_00405 [Candidatus Parcubacteria bacterium]
MKAVIIKIIPKGAVHIPELPPIEHLYSDKPVEVIATLSATPEELVNDWQYFRQKQKVEESELVIVCFSDPESGQYEPRRALRMKTAAFLEWRPAAARGDVVIS